VVCFRFSQCGELDSGALDPTPAACPIEVDGDGFLVREEDWSPEVAEAMAREDNVQLQESHWEIIRLLREYWNEQAAAPPIRILVKLVAARLAREKATGRYLYTLFPSGPARQACRYAGLPKPDGCV